MATGEIPALPLGVYAPLAVNNHEDRGGLIIVISAFALGVALVFLAIRGYIQQIRRTVWLDDVLLLVATVRPLFNVLYVPALSLTADVGILLPSDFISFRSGAPWMGQNE